MSFESIREFFEKYKTDWRLYAAAAVVLGVIILIIATSSPKNFPSKTIITIQTGLSLEQISQTLAEEHVINSPTWFRIMAITFGGERGIQAGDYYLPEPQSIPILAWRMVHGSRDLELIKITIPEG